MSDFKAKMHKFNFGWGSAPDSPWGSLQHSPKPIGRFKGALHGREGEGMGKGRGRGGEKGRERKGRMEEGRGRMEEGKGKMTEEMGRTVQYMGWDGKGREGKEGR